MDQKKKRNDFMSWSKMWDSIFTFCERGKMDWRMLVDHCKKYKREWNYGK